MHTKWEGGGDGGDDESVSAGSAAESMSAMHDGETPPPGSGIESRDSRAYDVSLSNGVLESMKARASGLGVSRGSRKFRTADEGEAFATKANREEIPRVELVAG